MTRTTSENPQAGHVAHKPSDIPKPGWKAVAGRVKVSLKRDHVSLLAAGVAFKALLALFPALVAVITVWGLFADPQDIAEQLGGFTDGLPEGAGELLEGQMTNIAAGATGTLSLALGISLALALWSASGGMAGLMEGCSAAYGELDERKFPVKRGIALLLTAGAVVFLIVSIALIAVLPGLLDVLGLEAGARIAVQVGQWVLLALMAIASLAVLYKYAPDRDHAQLRWVSWGAVLATVVWLAGSALFTLYVDNFGNFGETYGTFAGIIVLMLWLYLTAFIVLLGAEVNAEIERQTTIDVTEGDPEPMGARGAHTADTTPADFDRER